MDSHASAASPKLVQLFQKMADMLIAQNSWNAANIAGQEID